MRNNTIFGIKILQFIQIHATLCGIKNQSPRTRLRELLVRILRHITLFYLILLSLFQKRYSVQRFPWFMEGILVFILPMVSKSWKGIIDLLQPLLWSRFPIVWVQNRRIVEQISDWFSRGSSEVVFRILEYLASIMVRGVLSKNYSVEFGLWTKF
jgi:hypothetical protein